jgi:Domain of unknown function (DUF4118)
MFVCGVPRDSDEFFRVLSVEQELFGDLSVPPAIALEIFKSRPEIYTAIVGQNDTVAAYSSAYPLKREWAEAFVAGDITEPELTPSMLLGRSDSLEGSCVYIGSVVVVGQNHPFTKATLLASLLSWRVQQLKAASVKRLSVFMTPVAEQGERMIRFIGAKQLNEGMNRKDGYPVYGRVITPGFLSRATATMERCLNNSTVQMNLDFTPSVNHAQPIPRFDKASRKKAACPWTAAAFHTLANAKKAVLSEFASLRDMASSASNGIFSAMNAQRIRGVSMSITLVTIATAALLMAYAFFELDNYFELDHLIFVFLIPIFLIAIRYGKGHAAVALVASNLSAAFFFNSSGSSLYLDDGEDLLELVCFGAIALLICQFVGKRPIWAWIHQR